MRPPTQPPKPSTVLERKSIGTLANVKMLWNSNHISPTKIAMPQTRCVNTRSSLSLRVSCGTASSVTLAAMMSAMRA